MKKEKNKIVGIITVRMNSSRLPGKVMMQIAGKPVLGHIIERASRSIYINELVVATSINPENDILEDYCKREGIYCFRGSEDDVLLRMLQAFKSRHADTGVEIFGDEPLIDHDIIDLMISFYLQHIEEYDFVSNDLKTTYPSGVEAEVFSISALEDSSRRVTDPAIREHGTLYIRQHPEFYRMHNIESPPELRYPGLSIELDTREDLSVIRSIFEGLYSVKRDFLTCDVIDFLDGRPEVATINKNVHRRWKEFRSEKNV